MVLAQNKDKHPIACNNSDFIHLDRLKSHLEDKNDGMKLTYSALIGKLASEKLNKLKVSIK